MSEASQPLDALPANLPTPPPIPPELLESAAAGRPAFWGPLLRGLVRPGLLILYVLIAAPFAAWAFGAPLWTILGLAALPFLHLCILIQRRGGLGLVGPHFFYDLIRLGRRARTWDVRVLFTVGLLIGLSLVYFLRFPIRSWETLFDTQQRISLTESGNVAQAFVFTILFVQNLAVILLTPAYLCSVVAEERERGTLELLFTTHLRSHQIVLGKFFSRLLHLGLILVGGLPVLSLVQLWGGVDIPMLLVNYGAMVLNLVMVGAVSILTSVLAPRVVTAVMASYGIVLPVGLCFGLLSLTTGEGFMGMSQPNYAVLIVGAVAFHGPVTIGCLVAAVMVLRNQRNSEKRLAPPVPRRRRRRVEESKPVPAILVEDGSVERQVSIRKTRTADLPPVHAYPLLWKEMNLGLVPFWKNPVFYVVLALALWPVLGMFLVMGVAMPGRGFAESAQGLGYVIRFFLVVYAALFCIGVGYRAAAAMVRERQQKTLDNLLTLPVERREIYAAKWVTSLLRNSGWVTGILLMGILGLITTTIHPVGALLAMSTPLVHALFFASFGLYLSMVAKTVLETYVKMALTILALIGLTWFGGVVIAWDNETWFSDFIEIGLSPVRTWYFLGFNWDEFLAEGRSFDRRFGACLVGTSLYLVLAYLFWWAGMREFRKQQIKQVD